MEEINVNISLTGAEAAVSDLRAYTDSLESAALAQDKAGSSAAKMASGMDAGAAAIARAREETLRLRSAAVQAAEGNRIFQDSEESVIRPTEAQTAMLESQTRALLLQRDAQIKALDAHQNFAANMAKSAPKLNRLGLGIAASVTGGLYEGIKQYMAFNQKMTQSFTQAGVAFNKQKALTQDMGNIAKATGRSFNDMADALYRVASATAGMNSGRGASTSQLNSLVRQTANLQVLGNLSSGAQAEQAARIMGSVVNSGIGGSNVKTIAATTNAIVGAGDIRMSELITALGRGVLTSGKTVGLDYKQIGAFVDLLTSRGTTGASAGTYVAHAFQLLAGSTAQAANWQKAIGLGGGEMINTMKHQGLNAAVQLLYSHMQKLTNTPESIKMMQKAGLSSDQINAWIAGLQPGSDMQTSVMQRAMTAMFGGGRQAMPLMTLLQSAGIDTSKLSNGLLTSKDMRGPTYQEILDNINRRSNSKTYNKDVSAALNTPRVQEQKLLRTLQWDLIQFGKIATPIWLDLLTGATKVANLFLKFKGYLVELGAVLAGIVTTIAVKEGFKFAGKAKDAFGAVSYWKTRGMARMSGDNNPRLTKSAQNYAGKRGLIFSEEYKNQIEQLAVTKETLDSNLAILREVGSLVEIETLRAGQDKKLSDLNFRAVSTAGRFPFSLAGSGYLGETQRGPIPKESSIAGGVERSVARSVGGGVSRGGAYVQDELLGEILTTLRQIEVKGSMGGGGGGGRGRYSRNRYDSEGNLLPSARKVRGARGVSMGKEVSSLEKQLILGGEKTVHGGALLDKYGRPLAVRGAETAVADVAKVAEKQGLAKIVEGGAGRILGMGASTAGATAGLEAAGVGLDATGFGAPLGLALNAAGFAIPFVAPLLAPKVTSIAKDIGSSLASFFGRGNTNNPYSGTPSTIMPGGFGSFNGGTGGGKGGGPGSSHKHGFHKDPPPRLTPGQIDAKAMFKRTMHLKKLAEKALREGDIPNYNMLMFEADASYTLGTTLQNGSPKELADYNKHKQKQDLQYLKKLKGSVIATRGGPVFDIDGKAYKTRMVGGKKIKAADFFENYDGKPGTAQQMINGLKYALNPPGPGESASFADFVNAQKRIRKIGKYDPMTGTQNWGFKQNAIAGGFHFNGGRAVTPQITKGMWVGTGSQRVFIKPGDFGGEINRSTFGNDFQGKGGVIIGGGGWQMGQRGQGDTAVMNALGHMFGNTKELEGSRVANRLNFGGKQISAWERHVGPERVKVGMESVLAQAAIDRKNAGKNMTIAKADYAKGTAESIKAAGQHLRAAQMLQKDATTLDTAGAKMKDAFVGKGMKLDSQTITDIQTAMQGALKGAGFSGQEIAAAITSGIKTVSARS